MAFSTLDAVRTGGLNTELGLTGDSDDRFGTTTQRNYALQEAIRRLWPEMARLTRETITVTTDTLDYTLTTLREVAWLEQLDATATADKGFLRRLDNFRVWYDEEDASPVVRFTLPASLDPAIYGLRAVGYAPYTVPTSSPPSSSGTLDLQPEDEWIIVQGARALLYRRLLNSFAVYERHENENRKTFLTPEQLLTMSREAEGMFLAAKASRKRRVVAGKRATGIR